MPGVVKQSAIGDSFYFDGLDTSKSYSFYFSNKAPGTAIGSRAAVVQNDSNGDPIVSIKVSDVTPEEGAGLDLATVELKPTGTISGHAYKYDDEGNQESDNAGITVFIPGTSYSAYTDSNGEFAMSGVPQGLYTIRAMYAGYTYSEQENILLETSTDDEAICVVSTPFEVVYARGIVKGTVLLGAETGNSGVNIVLADVTGKNAYTASTLETGAWSVSEVTPGTYIVEISKDGYETQSLNDIIVVGARVTNVGKVVLKEYGGSLTGTVALSASTNLAGVGVTAVRDTTTGALPKTYYALTDTDGTFTFDSVAPGTYTVSATYAGYKSSIRDGITVAVGDSYNLGTFDISEKATYSVTGSCVLEGMESGFEGTNVLLQSASNSANTKSTTTNEDGVYVLADVDADSYVLTFSRTGFVTNSTMSVTVGTRAIAVVDTVVLGTNAGTVTGTVTLESAETSEGITILVQKEDDDTTSYTTVTDTTGHYAVAGVTPGMYRVQATKSGYNTGRSDPFTVSSGVTSSPADMQLSISSRALYGTVTLEGREDYTGVRITATKTTSTTEIYSALSNKDGFYALSGMTPGEYILSYSYESYRSYTSSSVSLTEDSSLNLDAVELSKATGKISGIVNLEGCTDHSGITVSLVGTDYIYTTQENGAYEFTVPSGNYPGGVRFEKEDYQLTAKAETIPVLTDSTYGVLTVEMKATANTIKGVTTLAGSDDNSGITVTVDGLDSSIYSATTDSEGNWELLHIPLGYQTVRFTKTNVPDVTSEIEVIANDYIDFGTLEMIPDSATLKGNIFLDGMSDHAGISVTVTTLDRADIVVRTTSDGAFEATNILASGSHTITFSKDGWNSQSITISDFTPLEERTIGADREYELTDTTAPTWGTSPITINSGANFANSTKLHIDLSPVEEGSGVEKMSVQLTREVDGVTSALYPTDYNWQNYEIGFDFELSDLPDQYVGNGTYTLYIALKDKSGNISEKASKAITITDLVTSLSGVLTGDRLHLTKENSPYIVEADCLVSEGDTLVIDPGVEVRFASGVDDSGNKKLYSISISGSIEARGTAEEKILFTKTDDNEGLQSEKWNSTTQRYEYGTSYWNGIAINGGSVSTENTYNYVSGNILEYCEFEYADTPLTIKAGAYINKCHFHDCTDYVTKEGEASDSTVMVNNVFESGVRLRRKCLFVNNKVSTYFYTNEMYYNTLIINNTFTDTSVTFEWSSYAYIQNNVFENCSVTISSSLQYNGYAPTITNNNFIDCSSPIVSTTETYVSGNSYNFTHNYWGSAQTDELNSKGATANISFISDYYDNFKYARIDYSNWATEAFENCGYSETGFVAFDYAVNGYDFTGGSGYYPESAGTSLSIELNPQYYENLITQMRMAQTYDELKAASWTAYTDSASFTVDKTKLVNGAATLYVQVKDSAGNCSSSVVHNIPYDTPVCTLSLEDGTTFGSTTKKQSVTYSATDLGNITAYTLSLDGSKIESGSGNSWGTGFSSSYTLPLAYMASGTHTLTMSATDSAGNTGETSVSFTINRNFDEESVKDISYNSATGQFYKDATTLHLWHLDSDGKEDSGSAEITSYTHTNGGFEGAASALNGTVALDISTNAFTVEFWTRGRGGVDFDKNETLEVYNIFDSTTSYNGWMYHYYETSDGISRASIYSSAATRTRSDDQWHYWAYVYESTYTAIYCDGVCVAYQDGFTHTLNTNAKDLSIYASGIVDELRISNNARSADEISSYYKTAKPILDGNTGSLDAIVW